MRRAGRVAQNSGSAVIGTEHQRTPSYRDTWVSLRSTRPFLLVYCCARWRLRGLRACKAEGTWQACPRSGSSACSWSCGSGSRWHSGGTFAARAWRSARACTGPELWDLPCRVMLAQQQRRESLVRTALLCCACLFTRTACAVTSSPPANPAVSQAPLLAFVHRPLLGGGGSRGEDSSLRALRRRRKRSAAVPERSQSEIQKLYGMIISKDRFERTGSAALSRGCSATAVSAEGEVAASTVGAGAAEAASEVLGYRWLLLRHGQTDFNAEGRVQGSSDTSRLSEEGREQAKAVGKFLATLQVDKTYVSPLSRAQETLQVAEKVAGKALGDSKTVLDNLREVDLHEWEGLYKQQIKDQWPDLYRHWRGESPGKFRVASGKYPIRDLWARAGVVWQQLLQEAEGEGGAESLAKIGTKRSLVIGHNGINQALLATALGLSEEAFRKFEFPNCGLVELVWNPGEPRAKLWRRVYPKPTAWEVVAEGQGELGSAVSDTEVDDESDASLSSLASPCTD